ncbi:MAG: RDD family protein [Rhodospirillales bacterium]|nr:RDD family protein [Rhodospirillales bacterium]
MSNHPSAPTSPVYAPFGRRVAALAVDAGLLGGAVVAIIAGINALAGPVFVPFWTTVIPVRSFVEPAGTARVREEGGIERETTTSRETRLYADGAVRIYAVIDATITGPDGQPHSSRSEVLIGESRRSIVSRFLTLLLAVAAPVGYFAAMEGSARQASLGKILFGLKVTDLAGNRLTPARALLRQATKCIDIATSGLTYVIAAFTERRQGLHDYLAGTLVVRA